MLSVSSGLRVASLVKVSLRRNLATSYVAAAAASDPIQQLFVDKVREYGTKKAASGGKMVDATAQTEAELKGQLEKIAKNFGGDGGVDMIKFPDFKFVDPTIEVGDIK